MKVEEDANASLYRFSALESEDYLTEVFECDKYLVNIESKGAGRCLAPFLNREVHLF